MTKIGVQSLTNSICNTLRNSVGMSNFRVGFEFEKVDNQEVMVKNGKIIFEMDNRIFLLKVIELDCLCHIDGD
jgi:hypothetical protein